MLIGADWVESERGSTLDVLNPATQHLLARVPDSSAEDVDRAVAAARSALPGWAGIDGRSAGGC